MQAELHLVGQRMHKTYGGRVVAAQNIHLTVAFIGSVPTERVDDLRAIGRAIKVGRIQLRLIRTGCWKRSGIGWIGPDHSTAALEDLVLKLREHLLQGGFSVDNKPFTPHVTLLRKAKCSSQPAPQELALDWEIDRYVLMRSDTFRAGPEYSQLAAWPLTL